MYRQLVDALRPKSLKEVPDEIFVTEEQSWFMEYTQNRMGGGLVALLLVVANSLQGRIYAMWTLVESCHSEKPARWSQILEEIFDSPTVQDWSVIPHILDSIPQLFQRYPPTIGSIPLCPWPK